MSQITLAGSNTIDKAVTSTGVGGKEGLDVNLLNGGGGGTSSNFGAAFPATGTGSGFEDPNGNMAPAQVDAKGNLYSASAPSDTATISQKTVSNSPVQLLAANPNRVKFRLKMGSTAAACLILYGGGVPSTSNYTDSLPKCGSANDGTSPALVESNFKGAVQAIVATGSTPVLVNVTEETHS